MQKRPRAFLFQIVTAKDRFRQESCKGHQAHRAASTMLGLTRATTKTQSTLLPKLHSAPTGLEYLSKLTSRGHHRLALIFIRGLCQPGFPQKHQWSTQMPHMTRACSMLIAAALGLVAAAAPALSQNAPQCVMSGSPPAGWGFNSIGYIDIASGGSCLFTVNVTGEILSSSVSQNPAHGTLQQLNVSSFVYTSQAGYRGSDAFSVQASGKSPTSSGTSVITVNATLQ